jgi:protein TonB
MSALILAGRDGREELRRWSLCAAAVFAVHCALGASYLLWPQASPPGSPMGPAVIVDLSPVPVAPSSPLDLAPGPEMIEAQATPDSSQPDEAKKSDPLPKIEAPAEATLPMPEPERAEVEKPVDKPDTKKPETVKAQAQAPAPRTTANPRSDLRTADVARAPIPGSAESRNAIATWRDLVAARLQQAKRYPSSAQANHEQGVAMLSFSVDRNGRVTARSIARSSGHASLDEEVLAMVMRAQPLPPFPPAMPQQAVHLTVPVRFSLR